VGGRSELEENCKDASRGRRPRGSVSGRVTVEQNAAAGWAEPLPELPDIDVPPHEVVLPEPGTSTSGKRSSRCG